MQLCGEKKDLVIETMFRCGRVNACNIPKIFALQDVKFISWTKLGLNEGHGTSNALI